MKKIKADVHIDSDFSNYVFVKIGNEIEIYRKITKWVQSSRGIESISLYSDKKKHRTLSMARIEQAIEMQRDVLDIRYVPQNKCFRVKKNALLLGLIRAKKELQEKNPRINLDEYIDDAYINILNAGYIPTDYADLKTLILKNVVAVKAEREHRRFEYDDNRRHGDDD